MTKEEYFNVRFRNDFLNYILKQPNSHMHSVIDRLVNTVIEISGVNSMFSEIDTLVADYFNHAKLRTENQKHHVNVMPEWLGLEYARQLIDEFDKMKLKVNDALTVLCGDIERLCWVANAESNLEMATAFKRKLITLAQSYRELDEPKPDDFELSVYEAKARQITLVERIGGSNHDDIMRYFTALSKYCEAVSRYNLGLKTAAMFEEVAYSDTLYKLIQKFESIAEYVSGASPEILQVNSLWDEEYERRIPVKFYVANVADITPNMAFRASLFNALAKHEAKLHDDGYLNQEGEFSFFTNLRHDGFRWLDINFTQLFDVN